MRRSERIVVRGLVAGLIGATVLAVWFLVIDMAQGRPFYTPSFLATVLAGVDGVSRSTGLILMYTALHYGAFFVVGVAVAWVLNKLPTAPSALLGLVLGFLLFDLVFYCGVVVTGVDVVEALGWPQVLFGNLLAGLGVMGYLHATLEAPSLTWWQLLSENRIVREGVVSGLLGAVAVAAWFLLFDLIRRQIFFTPGALGSAIFLGVSDLASVRVSVLTVGGYTVLHFLAFMAAGLVAAAIMVQAERTPQLLLGAVLLFAAFEAFFLGLLVIVAEWLLGALAWWTIFVGNLVASAVMAYYLWRQHPGLEVAVRRGPLAEID